MKLWKGYMVANNNWNMDGMKYLANAILVQAVKDLRCAKHLESEWGQGQLNYISKQLKDTNNWACNCLDIDGEYIVERALNYDKKRNYKRNKKVRK